MAYNKVYVDLRDEVTNGNVDNRTEIITRIDENTYKFMKMKQKMKFKGIDDSYLQVVVNFINVPSDRSRIIDIYPLIASALIVINDDLTEEVAGLNAILYSNDEILYFSIDGL